MTQLTATKRFDVYDQINLNFTTKKFKDQINLRFAAKRFKVCVKVCGQVKPEFYDQNN